MEWIWPIVFIMILTAGWAAVQLLARKVGTKNHIDNADNCGNGCTCMNTGACERKV